MNDLPLLAKYEVPDDFTQVCIITGQPLLMVYSPND
jgi:hypothetical protein